MKKNWLFLSYGFTLFLLFLYSFTQIDLGLVFSRSHFLFTIERSFQTIGYFNRPISTVLYLLLLGLLFSFFFAFLNQVQKKNITEKQFFTLVGVIIGILVFSYNAFSYDLFNYIFDARIFTFYHQNPYLHKALDYPRDPMLGFMHWTHRVYPYGPLWLGISIVLSYIGFSKFIITFFLFKLLAAVNYYGSIVFIGKILKKVNPSQALFGMALFAFNPLVVIEGLVSAHNDMVMLFLALVGIYLFLQQKKATFFIVILASIFTKYITGMLLIPLLISILLKKVSKSLSTENLFRAIVFFMLIGFMYMLAHVELQPWYFLWIIPFLSLLKKNIFVIAIIFGFSLGLLLEYAPFLYQGNWNDPVITIKEYVTTITPVLFLLGAIIYSKVKHAHK